MSTVSTGSTRKPAQRSICVVCFIMDLGATDVTENTWIAVDIKDKKYTSSVQTNCETILKRYYTNSNDFNTIQGMIRDVKDSNNKKGFDLMKGPRTTYIAKYTMKDNIDYFIVGAGGVGAGGVVLVLR